MIVEGIMNVFFAMLQGLFILLPDVSWDVENGFFSTFLEVIRLAGYFLPMETIASILSIIVGLIMFRIIISLIKTIWGLLPFA